MRKKKLNILTPRLDQRSNNGRELVPHHSNWQLCISQLARKFSEISRSKTMSNSWILWQNLSQEFPHITITIKRKVKLLKKHKRNLCRKRIRILQECINLMSHKTNDSPLAREYFFIFFLFIFLSKNHLNSTTFLSWNYMTPPCWWDYIISCRTGWCSNLCSSARKVGTSNNFGANIFLDLRFSIFLNLW